MSQKHTQDWTSNTIQHSDQFSLKTIQDGDEEMSRTVTSPCYKPEILSIPLPSSSAGNPPNAAPASAPLLAAAPEPQRCRRGREVINNPGRGAETAGRCTVWPDKYSLENHQRARAHPWRLEPAFQTWAAKYIGLPLLENRKEDGEKRLRLLHPPPPPRHRRRRGESN